MEDLKETDQPEIICCGREYLPAYTPNQELRELFRQAYEGFLNESEKELVNSPESSPVQEREQITD